MKRFILHSDLNNFYASVESLFRPEIRNKAVVVVGDEAKRHGIVLAKNYMAKSYNVKTGDTVWEARQKCKEELVCVPARLDLYLYISKLVKDIYREYSHRVESFGVDEAWIDISHIAKSFDEAKKIADSIRCRIIAEIGLTVSIGVSFNKIFAKLGSDMQKPNATVVITDQDYKYSVWKLPVEDLLYVGRATKKKFEKANIRTIGDLANTDIKYLKLTLGKMGETLWRFANGYDTSEVKQVADKEVIKSFGNSTTCPKDLNTNDQVKNVIYMLSESVVDRMSVGGYYATEVALWIKDSTLSSFDRQAKLSMPTNVSRDIANKAYELFLNNYNWELDIRAIGVRVSGLTDGKIQYDLFRNGDRLEKQQKLEKAIMGLRNRFGYGVIQRCSVLGYKELNSINLEGEKHIIHPVGFFRGK